MNAETRFEYAIGLPAVPVEPGGRHWDAALPLDRRCFPVGGAGPAGPGSISIGAYFTAVREFLTAQGADLAGRLAAAAGVALPGPAAAVRIHLIKHGAYYHPALVHFSFPGLQLPVLLNVAVSTAGRGILAAEAAALKKLRDLFDAGWVPDVYGFGRGAAGDGLQLDIFAAQWLEGFVECHAGAQSGGSGPNWIAWEEEGSRRLAPSQVDDFFEQAAAILATYYNPLSFEAILDWHHAAGDFVIRTGTGGIAVRLISVRRYAPLFEPGGGGLPDLRAVLDGLTIFWLITSLRLRVDRREGVGPLTWMGEGVMPAIWRGLMQGFARSCKRLGLPAEFRQAAIGYLAAHDGPQLACLGSEALARRGGAAGENSLLQQHLAGHAALLHLLANNNSG